MLALLSPAKTLDMETPAPVDDSTNPAFLDRTEELVKTLRKLSRAELGGLMHLSDKLTELNYDRYRRFETPFTLSNAKQAAYAFKGDTYVGLDAASIDKKDVPWMQNHIRILSGLYGILRPLDLMQAYRLEMGTKLKTAKGANLYDFWGKRLTDALNAETDGPIVNLASNEYISAIQPQSLKGGMITPQFKEMKNGVPKMIGIFAKRARGMMARFMIENKIDRPEGLKDFAVDGYKFRPKASSARELVFIRG